MKLSRIRQIVREEVEAVFREEINPYASISNIAPIIAKASLPTPPITKSQLAAMVGPVVQDMAFITSQQLANCVFYGTELQMKRLVNLLREKGLMPYFNAPRRVPSMDAFAVDTVKDMIKPE
jgi:hypothetical protein